MDTVFLDTKLIQLFLIYITAAERQLFDTQRLQIIYKPDFSL